VRREDWSESWKKYFKTVEVGTKLLIKPSWSRRRPRLGQAVVVLDPGLSFGTGQHPTTWFCLDRLVAARREGETQSFLDIGTGSGILAIAAVKLGYRPVCALDFDPVAVRVAKANASRNRVSQRIVIQRRDLTKLRAQSAAQFDVIGANLTDDLLIASAKMILSRLRPGGLLVLAGVLANQFSKVKSAYESSGFRLVSARIEREWQSATFRNSPP
jgi:ribosomal protein L11 methyltransferase